MNNLKKKVFASAAMLLVAAVMMTGSSFAWYTISQTGELNEVKVKMEATDNIEIAVASSTPSEVQLNGAGDQRTWGGTAVYGDEVTLKQLCQLDAPNVKVPTYDSTGRLEATLAVATQSTAASYDKTSADPKLWKAGDGQYCCAVYDFYIRSNTEDDITVSDNNSEFTATDHDNSLTVKFTNYGSSTVDATWTKGSTDSFTITPVAGSGTDDDGYYFYHMMVYVFADGDDFDARDLDSDSAKVAEFIGKIMLSRPTS